MALRHTQFGRTSLAFVFVVSGLMGFAATANAQDLANSTAPYIGFGLGEATMLSPGDTLAGNSFHASDGTWKLYTGFQLFGYIALEASYMHLPQFRGTGTSITDEWDAKIGSLTGVIRIPLGDDIAIFGKGGGTAWRVEDKVNNAGTITKGSKDGAGTIVGGGIELNLMNDSGASMRIEYELLSKVGDEALTGEGEIALWTAGFNWKF